MPIVYFRTSSGKALTKQIDWEVNYDRALQSVSKGFKIPKENIRLIYNAKNRTANFKLNPQIPHHIIHIKQSSKIAKEELKISLAIDNGKQKMEIKNIRVDPNTPAKEFIRNVLQKQKVIHKQDFPSQPQAFHQGIRLSDDETFLDGGVEDNGTVNVQLREDWEWPDPSDVNLCANLLKDQVDFIHMQLMMDPKYQNILEDLTILKEAGVILAFQQEYERQRKDVVFSPYPAYVLKPNAL